MSLPAVGGWPAGSAQCNVCGGHGCLRCDQLGWYPPKTLEEKAAEALLPEAPVDLRRKCENSECRNFIPPDHVAVYCSNDCARMDA